MPRKPRIYHPGALYHVMLRGNGGDAIFSDRADRTRFLLLLQSGIQRYQHRFHAYCLMDNHVHLAVQVAEIPLSKVIQNLAFRYTQQVCGARFCWLLFVRLTWAEPSAYGEVSLTLCPHRRPIMDRAEDIQKVLSQRLAHLKQTYGVERLGLFGSFSRNEQTPDSDIDLLVEFTKPVGFFQFLRLEKELSELLGRKVDLVTRNALKPHIGQRILGEVKHVQ